MSTIVEQRYFVCTDVEKNNNKYWKIEKYDNGDVVTRWGRVGGGEQSKTFSGAGDVFYRKKIAEKSRVTTGRDAYTEITIVDSGTTKSETHGKEALKKIALEQIESDPVTQAVIKQLTDINVHNIVSNTTIKYNVADNCFRTPLGIVSKENVEQAKQLLVQIVPFANANDFDNTSVKKLVNQYLRFIPQDLGGTQTKIRIVDVFGSNDKLQKQFDLIDALEASLSTVTTVTQTDSGEPTDIPRVFNTKLTSVTDPKIIGDCQYLFDKTRKAIHTSYGYKFKAVYALEIASVKEGWEKDGAKMSNIQRLWHGTSPGNVLSIIKSGLRIPTRYTNGWNFGAGLYFSDQSTKSLNYATGYWTGERNIRTTFMFLADVAMGNMYRPTRTRGGPYPQPGYDSTFAEGGVATVQNNEMIVYSVSRCNLVYLCEFEG